MNPLIAFCEDQSDSATKPVEQQSAHSDSEDDSTFDSETVDQSHGADSNAEPLDTSHESPQEVKKAKKRVYIPRRKDEGTKAREYFKAQTVPKSLYRFNGKQLDVDPD